MGTKIYFTALFLLISINKLHAQCAMCKAAVEANLKDGGSAGAGLNRGDTLFNDYSLHCNYVVWFFLFFTATR